MESPRPRTRPPRPASGWPRGPLLLVTALLTALILLALLFARLERWGQAAAEGPRAVAAAAERLARAFRTGTVTERFFSSLPDFAPAGAGRLEVAVAESAEILSRADERRAFWDLLPLGTTTVEIRVPVTYRYHLRFDEPWRISIAAGICTVEAPPLRPSLPPAIHTDRMEKRAESGWLRFDASAQLAAFERELTPTLSRLAADPRRVALAREPARATVATFVRRWLLGEGAWGESGVRAVIVRFADEPEEIDRGAL